MGGGESIAVGGRAVSSHEACGETFSQWVGRAGSVGGGGSHVAWGLAGQEPEGRLAGQRGRYRCMGFCQWIFARLSEGAAAVG